MSDGPVPVPSSLPSPRHSLVPRSCREDWRKNDDKVNGKGTERDEVRDVGWRKGPLRACSSRPFGASPPCLSRSLPPTPVSVTHRGSLRPSRPFAVHLLVVILPPRRLRLERDDRRE